MQHIKDRIRFFLVTVLCLALIGISIPFLVHGLWLYATFSLMAGGLLVFEILARYLPGLKDHYTLAKSAGILMLASTFVLNHGLLLLLIVHGEGTYSSLPLAIAYGGIGLVFALIYAEGTIRKDENPAMLNYYLFVALYAFYAWFAALVRYTLPNWDPTLGLVLVLLINWAITSITGVFSLSSLVLGCCRRQMTYRERFVAFFSYLNRIGFFVIVGAVFSTFLGVTFVILGFRDSNFFTIAFSYFGLTALRIALYFWNRWVNRQDMEEEQRRARKYKLMLFTAIFLGALMTSFGSMLTAYAVVVQPKEFNWLIYATGSFFLFRVIGQIHELHQAKKTGDPGYLSIAHLGLVLSSLSLYVFVLSLLTRFASKDIYTNVGGALTIALAAAYIWSFVRLLVIAVKGLQNTKKQ